MFETGYGRKTQARAINVFAKRATLMWAICLGRITMRQISAISSTLSATASITQQMSSSALE
jgi:hypothetical protein